MRRIDGKFHIESNQMGIDDIQLLADDVERMKKILQTEGLYGPYYLLLPDGRAFYISDETKQKPCRHKRKEG